MPTNMRRKRDLNLSLPLTGPPAITLAQSRKKNPPLSVAGLFAGTGGVELGLERAGHSTLLLCEIEPAAKAVLARRFPGIPIHGNVTTLRSLPKGVELLTGGFPCQDLSQAGRAAGILSGKQSSLVSEIFRLIQARKVPWVLLENVPFMLKLDSGNAMNVLASAFEELGYKWAYRVVDSLSFGVPQRRQRVIFLASHVGDPREVLFADQAAEPDLDPNQVGKVACGFYWTEGIRGLGWAVNAVPTLKGGSTIGIPSPPAIVFPNGFVGTPDIRDAERMQGFPAGWTSPAKAVVRDSLRWKLVGNAVTVGVFRWVGQRLREPHPSGAQIVGKRLLGVGGWKTAGWNVGAGRFSADMSTFPHEFRPIDLERWLRHPVKPLSMRATKGFLSRTEQSMLRFPPGFLDFLRRHLATVES